MAISNNLNRQIGGAGHTRETGTAGKSKGSTGSGAVKAIKFAKVNVLDMAEALSLFRAQGGDKDEEKKKRKDSDSPGKAQRDYIEQINKIPDMNKSGLKQLANDLLYTEKDLRDADINSSLKKNGFTDPSHAYLALRSAKDNIVETLHGYAFRLNEHVVNVHLNRLESIETFIQNFMEKNGEAIFSGINSGEEQAEFSKQGLGTPQVLRDYYRSIIKEHKSVLDIYKDVIGKHGVANFETRCDFLMKFVSRHLECSKGKYDSVKLQLMHKEIHLLRSVQSEIDRVGDFFSQYDVKKSGKPFLHKVFEQVVGMVEAVSVREAQISGLHSLCSVKEPKAKISVVNNLMACISEMPDTLFPNTTSRIKIRMMITNLCEKLQMSAGETLEELAKSKLYFKAGGFKADAADPALDSLKNAAYYPGDHDDASEAKEAGA